MPFHFCADEARMLLLAVPFAAAGFSYLRNRWLASRKGCCNVR